MRLILACLLILPATAFAADNGSAPLPQRGMVMPEPGRCASLQTIKDQLAKDYHEKVIIDRPDDKGTRFVVTMSDETFSAIQSTLDGKFACVRVTDPPPPDEEQETPAPTQPRESDSL